MKNRIKIIAAILAAAMLTACSGGAESSESIAEISVPQGTSGENTTTTTEAIPEPEPEPEPEPYYTSVRMLCAGDNLIHSPIYNQAAKRAGEGENYDFSYAYQYVADIIAAADLAILNQETIITDEYAPDTYPCFCTPSEMGDEMVEIGFDAISIGNNHVLDKGEGGLIATLDYWQQNHPEIPVYGAYRSEEDMNNIRTLTVNDITFAFLSYMEHTNGLSLPAGSECELVYLSELDLIEKQVKEAAEKYDCVIVSAHFGIETTNEITQSQYDTAQQLADWGADIIIGTQPHTIQSMEYLEKADGGQAFVFYCLGNFLSAQSNPYCMVEMLGEITITKEHLSGEITISDAGAMPLINHYDYGYSNIRVYPYSMYTEELMASHGCDGMSYYFVDKLIRENIPSEFLIL